MGELILLLKFTFIVKNFILEEPLDPSIHSVNNEGIPKQ